MVSQVTSSAHRGAVVERDTSIAVDGGLLGATISVPAGAALGVPGILIVGGSLSTDRDGRCADSTRPRVPERTALKRLAHRLAEAGYASLRYDRRQTLSSDQIADDLSSAFDALRREESVDTDRTCIIGESAGAYWACMSAERGIQPSCYVLLGALFSTIEELYRYNFERVRRYAFSSPDRLQWVRATAPRDLAAGLNWRRVIEAAYAGREFVRIEDEGRYYDHYVSKMRYELTHPPAALFRHLRRPALVMQGTHDMNVPRDDAFGIAAALRDSGNTDVRVHLVEGADHSFQEAAPTFEERVRERISLESFNRPYAEDFYRVLIGYLSDKLAEEAD